MTCRRCGCRMIAKSSQAKGLMICVDCGEPVTDGPRQNGVGPWLYVITVLLSFLMLAGLITMFDGDVDADRDAGPAKERSGAD